MGRRMLWKGALLATALGLGTIGCGQKPAENADVATLQQPGASGDEAPGTTLPAASSDPQEAFQQFAKCMRDHGVDMPDPQVSEDGKGGMVIMGNSGGGAGKAPDKEKMQTAQKECEPLIKDVVNNGERPDPEEEARMKEQALGFAKCMREHGVDMPDPVFEDGGGMTQEMGGGLDPNSSTLKDAQKACEEFMRGPNGELPPMIEGGGPGEVVKGGDGGPTPAGGATSKASAGVGE